MATLPDSPVAEGRRTIRSILVIDEAHDYLGQKNIFLQRIIREERSKDVVVFFASQSPNDYQQKFFNFQELLELAYIFQCDGVAAGSVQDILGCSMKTAKDLQTEIARLEPWQVIARSEQKTDEFVKFTSLRTALIRIMERLDRRWRIDWDHLPRTSRATKNAQSPKPLLTPSAQTP
jgi:DNA sulfur modification protein DndE